MSFEYEEIPIYLLSSREPRSRGFLPSQKELVSRLRVYLRCCRRATLNIMALSLAKIFDRHAGQCKLYQLQAPVGSQLPSRKTTAYRINFLNLPAAPLVKMLL